MLLLQLLYHTITITILYSLYYPCYSPGLREALTLHGSSKLPNNTTRPSQALNPDRTLTVTALEAIIVSSKSPPPPKANFIQQYCTCSRNVCLWKKLICLSFNLHGMIFSYNHHMQLLLLFVLLVSCKILYNFRHLHCLWVVKHATGFSVLCMSRSV